MPNNINIRIPPVIPPSEQEASPERMAYGDWSTTYVHSSSPEESIRHADELREAANANDLYAASNHHPFWADPLIAATPSRAPISPRRSLPTYRSPDLLSDENVWDGDDEGAEDYSGYAKWSRDMDMRYGKKK